MNYYPNEDEVRTATILLVEKFKISTQLLSKLFGLNERDQANKVLQKLSKQKLTPYDIARLLIIRKGTELFSGRDNYIRELRKKLLQTLSEQKINTLYNKHVIGDNTKKTPSTRLTHLANMKWHPSGPWPRSFVKALGFPLIFSGIRQKETAPTIETIHFEPPAPELTSFQKQIKKEMLRVINQNGNKMRCMVSLPTGGGKTRVAVEAYIEWMHNKFQERKFLIWIAQSEELCEQAISHLKQMWKKFGYVCPLTIYRYFGNRELSELEGGAVVTSIQKLHNRIKSNDEAIETILTNTDHLRISW